MKKMFPSVSCSGNDKLSVVTGSRLAAKTNAIQHLCPSLLPSRSVDSAFTKATADLNYAQLEADCSVGCDMFPVWRTAVNKSNNGYALCGVSSSKRMKQCFNFLASWMQRSGSSLPTRNINDTYVFNAARVLAWICAVTEIRSVPSRDSGL